MCLILLAWQIEPQHHLVVAANRDEFHARSARAAAFWEDRPQILAGRDLQAMGTWMGIARNGRFAAVTNYRGGTEPGKAHSRGALVTRFLETSDKAGAYARAVRGSDYSGYNLLVSDGAELWWTSNRDGTPRRLEPGLYGLGNLLLDSPEIEPDKARFARALAPVSTEPLFEVLVPAKVLNPHYGTRCSTVLLAGRDGRTRYAERAFAPDGTDLETVHYEF